MHMYTRCTPRKIVHEMNMRTALWTHVMLLHSGNGASRASYDMSTVVWVTLESDPDDVKLTSTHTFHSLLTISVNVAGSFEHAIRMYLRRLRSRV